MLTCHVTITQGPFCEELRAQHLRGFLQYSQDVTTAIKNAVPLAAPGHEQEITVATAWEAIKVC